MRTALLVLEIVAPVFILASLGVAWVRLGFEYRVAFVSRLAMKLALPCLIFMALVETEMQPSQITTIALASLVAHALIIPVFWVLTKVASLDVRTYLSPLIFGNTGNLGLPLAFFAFGQVGLDIAVIVFAVSLVLSFTLGIWIVSGGGNLTVLIKEPSVVAISLAVMFLITGFQLPNWTANTIELIGQMAIPLMLLTLGVAVARLETGGMSRAVLLALIKLIVCFAAAWVTAAYFDLTSIAFAVLVLQMTTPVAVTAYLIAEGYGARAQEVAALVVVSTIMSVGAMPLILSLFV